MQYNFDENELLFLIQKSFYFFIINFGNSAEGMFKKLRFISAMFKEHDITEVTVEQDYGFLGEKFICNAVIISYYSDMYLAKKKQIVDKLITMQAKIRKEDDYNENNSNIVLPIIWPQKNEVVKLYNKVFTQINDKTSAILLTALFIFELELLNKHNLNNLIFFHELYDSKNPLDKWFVAIDIELKKSQILSTLLKNKQKYLVH